MREISEEALELARVVWDYHCLNEEPSKADAIVALGTNDLRVAEYAASLFREGYGRVLLCTGGIAHDGDLLQTPWEKTEAEMYAEVAQRRGVPRGNILLETRATNTSENIRFSRELLSAQGVAAERLLIVVKPFMQRRARATLDVEWPDARAAVVSQRMTLDGYFTGELTAEKIINIMLGDLQRIWVYGRKGWSAPQVVPDEVMDAYRGLVQMGFNRHLIPES